MLAILSEINCLRNLQKHGVYPDEFYTDLELFKNNVVSFREATIIVIFAGNCQFNKKHTIEFIKTLTKRSESEQDTGIKHVYVVSDMTIAGLRSYYKYIGNIDRVSIMHGWKSVKDDVDIWKKLQCDERDCRVYLSPYDNGVVDDAVKAYENRHNQEDEYCHLIQVPDIKTLLKSS